jgi:hypothetical protein
MLPLEPGLKLNEYVVEALAAELPNVRVRDVICEARAKSGTKQAITSAITDTLFNSVGVSFIML